MSLSSFRYLLREGFRSLWQNRFMALASVGVLVACLILTGGAYLIFENIDSAFDMVYSQNVAVAFADVGITEDRLQAVRDELEGITNIADIEFISRDEALDRYSEQFPDALLEQLQGENNPMQDSFVISFEDLEKFDATVMQIEKIEGIEEVKSRSEIADMLTSLRQVVLAVGGWIIGILLVVSLFIISNTIKLTVYNRRLEIYIMKSVGATDAFIRIPFVVEGMTLGLISGGVSYGLLYYIYTRLAGLFTFESGFRMVAFSNVWLPLLIVFLAAGLLIGAVGSAISMGKYLRDRGNTEDARVNRGRE